MCGKAVPFRPTLFRNVRGCASNQRRSLTRIMARQGKASLTALAGGIAAFTLQEEA